MDEKCKGCIANRNDKCVVSVCKGCITSFRGFDDVSEENIRKSYGAFAAIFAEEDDDDDDDDEELIPLF